MEIDLAAVETEEDAILVHHPDHLYDVEDAILIPVQDLSVAAFPVEEDDLTLAIDAVTLVDAVILVAEAILEVWVVVAVAVVASAVVDHLFEEAEHPSDVADLFDVADHLFEEVDLLSDVADLLDVVDPPSEEVDPFDVVDLPSEEADQDHTADRSPDAEVQVLDVKKRR